MAGRKENDEVVYIPAKYDRTLDIVYINFSPTSQGLRDSIEVTPELIVDLLVGTNRPGISPRLAALEILNASRTLRTIDLSASSQKSLTENPTPEMD